MKKIERIYHPYNKWECWWMGLYETSCFIDDREMIKEIKSTLCCDGWLEECMKFITHNWKHSTEHHMTNTNRNRQAYLGQTACCWIHGAPEYLTKKAWGELSETQRVKANKVADYCIEDWEEKFTSGYFE